MKFINNKNWNYIWNRFETSQIEAENDYYETLNFNYEFSPLFDYYMTDNSNLFDCKKAAAVFFWYYNHNPHDRSICNYFDEYKKCIDEKHDSFNSNYGIYAFGEGGLDLCVERLRNNSMTRQAMFCINNKYAMSDNSIDKLCTNTIQFFIRKNKLIMVVQMRASNFISLLPYDSFMFSVFYMYVYNKLYSEYNYTSLQIGKIKISAASIHVYKNNIEKLELTDNFNNEFKHIFDEYQYKDFWKNLYDKMKNFL